MVLVNSAPNHQPEFALQGIRTLPSLVLLSIILPSFRASLISFQSNRQPKTANRFASTSFSSSKVKSRPGGQGGEVGGGDLARCPRAPRASRQEAQMDVALFAGPQASAFLLNWCCGGWGMRRTGVQILKQPTRGCLKAEASNLWFPKSPVSQNPVSQIPQGNNSQRTSKSV